MTSGAHPVLDGALYARAERAAESAMVAADAAGEPPNRRMRLMDRAGRTVFKAAGVSPDLADLYAYIISADVLERRTRRP